MYIHTVFPDIDATAFINFEPRRDAAFINFAGGSTRLDLRIHGGF